MSISVKYTRTPCRMSISVKYTRTPCRMSISKKYTETPCKLSIFVTKPWKEEGREGNYLN